MGVLILRDDNWQRLEAGVISLRDIMDLDLEKDRYLFDWLFQHFSESRQKMIMNKYHLDKLPEKLTNIDDPSDEFYQKYFVLREQVMRENDREVLKKAAFADDDIGRFAFCRLSGFSWPADANDAYSYRTYECGLKSGMKREDIAGFCQEMIALNGPYAKEAREWLSELSKISDEKLAERSQGNTERREL